MANWKQIMLRGAKLKSRIFRSRKIPSYLTENVTEDLIVLKNLVKVYDTLTKEPKQNKTVSPQEPADSSAHQREGICPKKKWLASWCSRKEG